MKSRQHRKQAPGRPFSKAGRDTRDLLLTAATNLFGEYGVAATSLTDIARKAGLTPAMIHYHFKDRGQLIDAVVDERMAPLIHYVWDAVQPGERLPELITGVVQRLLEQIQKAPWLPATWMREVLNEGGLLRNRIVKRLPFDKVQLVALALQKEQESHTANPDLEPQLLVFSTLGLVMLHMSTVQIWAEIFHRPPLTLNQVHRHLNGLLLYGIHGPSSKPGSHPRRKAPIKRRSKQRRTP
jgi:AcrR family transcriptional regulator